MDSYTKGSLQSRESHTPHARRFFVYILYSEKFSRTYLGQTNNLDSRLSRHNAGAVLSTKAYRPWIRIHSESFTTRKDAVARERWFKTGVGRERVQNIVEEFRRH